MDIDNDEEHEAPKDVDTKPYVLVKHPLDHKEKPERPNEPMDTPRVIVLESKKRPTWLRKTLQYAEGHAAPCVTF